MTLADRICARGPKKILACDGGGGQVFDKASLLKRLRYSCDDEPLAGKLRVELKRVLGHAEGALPATLAIPACARC